MSEAALSFPGFVLPIKIPSWGGMLSREGRQYSMFKFLMVSLLGHIERGFFKNYGLIHNKISKL